MKSGYFEVAIDSRTKTLIFCNTISSLPDHHFQSSNNSEVTDTLIISQYAYIHNKINIHRSKLYLKKEFTPETNEQFKLNEDRVTYGGYLILQHENNLFHLRGISQDERLPPNKNDFQFTFGLLGFFLEYLAANELDLAQIKLDGFSFKKAENYWKIFCIQSFTNTPSSRSLGVFSQTSSQKPIKSTTHHSIEKEAEETISIITFALQELLLDKPTSTFFQSFLILFSNNEAKTIKKHYEILTRQNSTFLCRLISLYLLLAARNELTLNHIRCTFQRLYGKYFNRHCFLKKISNIILLEVKKNPHLNLIDTKQELFDQILNEFQFCLGNGNIPAFLYQLLNMQIKLSFR